MALVIAVTGLTSFPLTMAEYRDKGVLRRLLVTPASPLTLLLAQLVVNVVLTIMGLALLVLEGAVFFDLHMAANWAAFVPVFLLVLVSTFSIRLLIASWAPNERTATMVAMLVYFPVIFLSGAALPLELMPAGMQTAVKVLPLTWGGRPPARRLDRECCPELDTRNRHPGRNHRRVLVTVGPVLPVGLNATCVRAQR